MRNRQGIECAVFKDVCAALLKQGYYLNVNTGDREGAWEFSLPGSRDLDKIVDACYGVDDEAWVYAHCENWDCEVWSADGKFVGEITCISGGNEPYYLCADYSDWLEDIIGPIVDKWEDYDAQENDEPY